MYIFDHKGAGQLLSEADIERLQSWSAGDRIPESHDARMRSGALFPNGARALAANMLAAGESDKALDSIFKDAGRYMAAMFAMYLHVSGGLTLPRLKEVCASSGYLSPGRARALLLYMRYLGYVAATPGRPRGEPARYEPTAIFTATWRTHLRAALDAACVIEPAVALVLDRLDERAVLDSVSRVQGEGLLASARDSDQSAPFVRVFMHRHAGLQILWTLILADESDTFPPRKPMTFSIGGLARRFGVSRIHVRRLLDEAVRENLLTLDENGLVTFTDGARGMLEFLYAAQLIRLLSASAKTLAEMDSATTPMAAA
jgi:hypothetical protein